MSNIKSVFTLLYSVAFSTMGCRKFVGSMLNITTLEGSILGLVAGAYLITRYSMEDTRTTEYRRNSA